GTCSKNVARPCGKPMTARSLMTRSTDLAEVSGRLHFLTILDFPLAVVALRRPRAWRLKPDPLRHPCRHHFARNHPVRKVPCGIHLQTAKPRHVDMAAADQCE